MANTQTQFGFRQVDRIGGSSPNYAQGHATIQSTYSTVIAFGDPVAKSGAYVIKHPADGTSAVVGIFVGCNPTYAAVGYPQWFPGWSGNAANADAKAYIISDPQAVFLAAALNTAITTAHIGGVVNFTGGAGATTGAMISTCTIDIATLVTTALQGTASLLPFKIVDLYQGIGNGSDPTTAYNWALVTFNNQVLKNESGV